MRSTDVAARIDEDGFALVVDAVDRSDAKDRLFEAVERSVIDSDQEMKAGWGIGLTQLKDSDTLDEWLERAKDTAWYVKNVKLH